MSNELKFLIVVLAICLAIAGIWGQAFLRYRRRERLKRKIFPPYWIAILEDRFPLYQCLPEPLKRKLQSYIQVFLAEKNFIGCNGLQITDEIKLAIASPACLLLLHERADYFAPLKDIFVYPTAFLSPSISPFGDSYLESVEAKSGESWQKGLVVLSWEHIERDRLHWQDGHHVILHEFAHQLDQENGAANGVPTLENKAAYSQWSKVLSREYRQLCSQVERGQKTAIDEYGATNPAEFFAVATETFFEKPNALKAAHPELYEELKSYYKLDPSFWLETHFKAAF
ncbi:M90 family metallopeptidase [Oscillatoria sp. FACHB-1406]|uniref:M90 family metallopeptidase n=1 Tax=Oscillatoria sp. FACHB-1406 TaxID=2692846 RepID=UPI00168815CE|nr:M90 family metallopeptidase [Oscillatoria sp. FACHB-1406]MBD2576903.1 zinc-dependent peptidase [Oscillatoria sp. FACHB-1406]